MDEFTVYINSILQKSGIEKNTQSWRDYEKLKQLCLQSNDMSNPAEYLLMINEITKWVNL